LSEEPFFLRKCAMKSMGMGKMMVEFFSAEIELSVCGEKGNDMRLRGSECD
jgi:hypothetical protein